MSVAKGAKLRSLQERKSLAMRIGQMKVMGASNSEIIETLGVPEGSIYWLLKEYRRMSDPDFKKAAAHDVARELMRNSRERVKHLWRTVMMVRQLEAEAQKQAQAAGKAVAVDTKQIFVKLAALDQIRREDEQLTRLCQALGYVDQAPIKFQGQLTLVDLMKLGADGNGSGSADGGTVLEIGQQPGEPGAEEPGGAVEGEVPG